MYSNSYYEIDNATLPCVLFSTGLGSTESNTNCHRDVWICNNSFRHISSPQDQGYGWR